MLEIHENYIINDKGEKTAVVINYVELVIININNFYAV